MTPSNERKLRKLAEQMQRLDDRIGQLMSKRVEIEEKMAELYHDPR